MRLEKFLALAGVASRRSSKEIVLEGRVTVNRQLALEPGLPVDENADEVRLDGTRIRLKRRLRYLILNKPEGYLCTVRDPQGRKTVYDLLPPMPERVVPVGRLDADTEGLLLLTNDGDLAFRLTHPRFKVPKVYHATIKGFSTDESLEKLRQGVFIDGRRTSPAQVTPLHRDREKSRLQIVLHEGRKRQVRLMCLAVGLPVRKLRRVQLGPLTLDKLPKGACRELTAAELRALRRAAQMDEPDSSDEGQPKTPRFVKASLSPSRPEQSGRWHPRRS